MDQVSLNAKFNSGMSLTLAETYFIMKLYACIPGVVGRENRDKCQGSEPG
jgi:hypothetical protein